MILPRAAVLLRVGDRVVIHHEGDPGAKALTAITGVDRSRDPNIVLGLHCPFCGTFHLVEVDASDEFMTVYDAEALT